MGQSDRVWFPAKTDCKWLWDLPSCWQGWVVVVTWWLVLVAGVVYLPTVASPAVVLPLFVVVMTAILTGICYLKGERLQIWE